MLPGAKAHLLHSLINGADDGGAGVVGVEGGGPGRLIFLRGQQLLQLRILSGPRGFVRVKGVRHAAPAHIAGQHFLLFRRSLPGGFLQVFQQLDCRHISLVLGLGPPSPKWSSVMRKFSALRRRLSRYS